jgi:hypothetical protein
MHARILRNQSGGVNNRTGRERKTAPPFRCFNILDDSRNGNKQKQNEPPTAHVMEMTNREMSNVRNGGTTIYDRKFLSEHNKMESGNELEKKTQTNRHRQNLDLKYFQLYSVRLGNVVITCTSLVATYLRNRLQWRNTLDSRNLFKS